MSDKDELRLLPEAQRLRYAIDRIVGIINSPTVEHARRYYPEGTGYDHDSRHGAIAAAIHAIDEIQETVRAHKTKWLSIDRPNWPHKGCVAELAVLRERLRPRDPATEKPPVGVWVLVLQADQRYWEPASMNNANEFCGVDWHHDVPASDVRAWMPMPPALEAQP